MRLSLLSYEAGNNLLGTIPSEIRLLQRLEKLDLGNNKLEGIIPSEIGELTEMTFLSLNTNYFTGSIPQEIGQMTKAGMLHMTNLNQNYNTTS